MYHYGDTQATAREVVRRLRKDLDDAGFKIVRKEPGKSHAVAGHRAIASHR